MIFYSVVCCILLTIVNNVHSTSHHAVHVIQAGSAAGLANAGSVLGTTSAIGAGATQLSHQTAKSNIFGINTVANSEDRFSEAVTCISDGTASVVDKIAASSTEAISTAVARGAARLAAVVRRLNTQVASIAFSAGASVDLTLNEAAAALVAATDCTANEAKTIVDTAAAAVKNTVASAAKLSVGVARANSLGAQAALIASAEANKHIAGGLLASINLLTHHH